MKGRRTRIAQIAFLAVGVVLLPLFAQANAAGDGTLTFFGWSDQHIPTDGNGSHLIPGIDAMNALPGTVYPEAIGGTVERPVFVFGCGDITEWPTNAAKTTYEELVTKRLNFPTYDVIGNHDEGGNAPSPTIAEWLKARHGALSYTFEKGGVRFLAVYSEYDEGLNNPAQPLTREALEFVRRELAKVPPGAPVVVATHLCYDAMTNRDELVDAFGNANVLMVLGGHYHKAKVDQYRGVHFVQLPSPAPNGQREFTVVRIGPNRLAALPYSYEKKTWVLERRKVLDTPIRKTGDR